MQARYFNYLLSKVGMLHSEYTQLCLYMSKIEFRWDYTIELDGDRAEEGKALRVLYYKETGSNNTGLSLAPCTVLEMLVALAMGMEEIMGEPGNDHPERWFNDMIFNLGLSEMTDDNYNEYFVSDAIGKWMMRDYDKNGHGGLFPLSYKRRDQRRVPIWEQAGAYMSERV